MAFVDISEDQKRREAFQYRNKSAEFSDSLVNVFKGVADIAAIRKEAFQKAEAEQKADNLKRLDLRLKFAEQGVPDDLATQEINNALGVRQSKRVEDLFAIGPISSEEKAIAERLSQPQEQLTPVSPAPQAGATSSQSSPTTGFGFIADTARKKRADEALLNKAKVLEAEEKIREYSLPYGETKSGKQEVFKTELDRKKTVEDRTIPGLGIVKTVDEAKKIREAASDATDAAKLIDKIKTLGKNVTVFDRKKIAEINTLKNTLVGKLRVPLTGPGSMTESDFQRLIETLGDPTKFFGAEEIEFAKLDQVKEMLGESIKSKFNLAAEGGATAKDIVDSQGRTAESLGLRPLSEAIGVNKSPNASKIERATPIKDAKASDIMNPTSHPQAPEALDWAKRNPNDPRAQAIMRRFNGL
jgi:hypothetical protein